MTDLSKLLNPEQFEAATAPDGPLLILAAAGTGKTRTLVYRTVNIIERGYRPEEVLLLTFTNKAAREMLERANAVAKGITAGLWGGTFHAVALRMLRRNAALLGFRNDFPILDADDQRQIVAQCIKSRGYKLKEFPSKDIILSILSGAVNRRQNLEDYLDSYLESEPLGHGDQILGVIHDYQRRKIELGAMDFDDLLVNILKLLKENPKLLEFYQSRFAHVLVDEYQDTNALQSEFVDMISAVHGNLSVVGDDFQCIYSWRGSDYNNILEFPNRHPGARIVKLERNYRSHAPILNLANASISHNTKQFAKTLRPIREGCDVLPSRIDLPDNREQGRRVVEIVRSMLSCGYKEDDIAILYRAHFNVLDTQMALARAHIPYTITSGVSFYEQQHIKDVLSLIRLAQYPTDEISFVRILSLLPGVGQSTVEKMWGKIGGSFDIKKSECFTRLDECLPARARASWSKIASSLKAYTALEFPLNVTTLIRDFLDVFYDEYMVRTFENFDTRRDEVLELSADIAQQPDIEEFLGNVTLLTNLDKQRNNDDTPSVLLSTVHQAKGLEWPVVILVSVAEGMFPSSRSLEEDGSDEEERRLFYVAVTRARDRLFITVPEMRYLPDGGVYPCVPSRFLTEVPQNLISYIAPVKRKSEYTSRFNHNKYNWGWE